MKGIELLCTLGPASFNKSVVSRLEGVGATLFRINLSHTPEREIEPTVRQLLEWTDVPICLDTEGAQIRTGALKNGSFEVTEDDELLCTSEEILGDKSKFYLHPGYVVREIRIGDLVHLDFEAAICQVIGKPDKKTLALRVINRGRIGQNKAVTVDRPIRLNPLTTKDIAAINIGMGLGIKYYALSFAHRGEDVDAVRQLVGDGARIISKIECISGLLNLEDICRRSNAILIDRGDLSREMPIEIIPVMQRRIVEISKSLGVAVYVATNLLESMTKAPSPTRAEVNDIYSALESGVNGLVLASETAIGKYPVQSAAMVMKLAGVFKSQTEGGMSPGVIGGRFVDSLRIQFVSEWTAAPEPKEINRQVVAISAEQQMICEALVENLLFPITSFMNKATLSSVIEHGRLPNRTAWMLPVFLAVNPEITSQIRLGSVVLLKTEGQGKGYELEVEDIFPVPVALPGSHFVPNTLTVGHHCLAGTLVASRHVDRLPLALTSEQCKRILAHKGWNRVCAVHHGRSFPRVTRMMVGELLKVLDVDGILINAFGARSENHLLSIPGSILNGILPIKFEIETPRDLLLASTAYRNLGCTHLIVEGTDLRKSLDVFTRNTGCTVSDGPIPGTHVIRV